MGGNFKFQVQDSFLEFILEIWRFEKRIALSEKKSPLVEVRVIRFFFQLTFVLKKLFIIHHPLSFCSKIEMPVLGSAWNLFSWLGLA